MANKIFNIRVKNKRDTEANWKKKNPVLLDGEIIIVTTTSGDTRFKVGDGKKTYNQLPFQDQKTRDLIPSVDSSLSSTSTNPVQNKIIKSELDKKAERDVVNTTTNGLMSVADKKKLDGIAAGANKTTVDSALSSTSTNPVQNKVVNDALKGKFSTSGGGISGDVTMFKRLDVKGVLDAHETIMAEKDVQCLYDNNSRIRLACDSSGAAKITTDGLRSYARLKIASPTDNDDATTKNYVDTGLSGKFDKSGGTLTGNLTGKYITGTWLQTTESTDLGRTPGKIAVLDESGLVYYRTPPELLADLGTQTLDQILGLVYPVGSIYMSINNVSPATLFGGKWVQIKGRFLLGASDVYKANTTGGEVAHTLTNDEMPNHQHSIWFPNSGGEQSAEIGYPEAGSKNTYYAEASKTSGTGGGAAHNNMPPYLVVYMWRRLS
nr:MAG TPA: baseplate wedge protein [Caudoviricetes sp.]